MQKMFELLLYYYFYYYLYNCNNVEEMGNEYHEDDINFETNADKLAITWWWWIIEINKTRSKIISTYSLVPTYYVLILHQTYNRYIFAHYFTISYSREFAIVNFNLQMRQKVFKRQNIKMIKLIFVFFFKFKLI